MRRFPVIVVALLMAAASPAPKSVKVLMQEKLATAQTLLSALTLENYAEMEKAADTLRMISRATSWHQTDSADFQHYAKSFQNSADFLVAQAKAKNLEGVSMGYVRLTLDCVQCHNYVRAGRSIRD